MAIYHMHASVISYPERSAVAAAAYRSGTCLTNKKTGTVHDYTKKQGVVHSEVVLPDSAPRRWLDRETLWNESQRARGACARELEYALARELSRDEQIAFARAFARSFADEGMAVDFCIHDTDGHNPHVHMLLSTSPCDENGFKASTVNEYYVRDDNGEERCMTADEIKNSDGAWAKTFRYKDGSVHTQAEAEAHGLHPTRDRKSKTPLARKRYANDWHTPEKHEEWRARLAAMQNEAFAAAGSEVRIDHRSYAEQGVDKIPTRHEGYAVRKAERIAEERAVKSGYEYQPVTDIRKENNLIKAINRKVVQMVEKMKRSFEEVRRSMNDVAKGRSANAQRRANRARRAGRRARAHGGMGR